MAPTSNDALTLFSPSAPVDKEALFAGRQSELQSLIEAWLIPGRHAILFGERGVGKTSLANIFRAKIDAQAIKNGHTARVTCESNDTHATVMRKLLREIELPTAGIQRAVGFSSRPVPTTGQVRLDQLIEGDFAPDDIRYAVDKLGLHLTLIIDEFDRLARDQRGRFADAVKVFSDNATPIKLTLVGVADNVSDLLSSHASVERALAQVRLPRMNLIELSSILMIRLQQLNMDVQDQTVVSAIAHLAQGFPHFVHLIGLGSVVSTINASRLDVSWDDFRQGLNFALDRADQSLVEAYLEATTSPRRDALYKKVISSASVADCDPQGYFKAQNLLPHMRKLHGDKVAIGSFSRHLDEFCDPKRGAILERRGTSRRYQYRFHNPMLKVYAILQAVNQNFIQIENVRYTPPQRTLM